MSANITSSTQPAKTTIGRRVRAKISKPTATRQPLGAPTSCSARPHPRVVSVLQVLEADYSRYGNPVYALKALAIAGHAGIGAPAWALAYLFESVDRSLKGCDEVAGGAPIQREAELVGKAFNFGGKRPGRGTSWFGHAALLQRHREIYSAVAKEVQIGTKLYFAYYSVAKASRVSPSTVRRAYLRIKNENDG
jgi:hypothetical protein